MANTAATTASTASTGKGRKTVMRKAGGTLWEDPTLMEWDPSEFLCCSSEHYKDFSERKAGQIRKLSNNLLTSISASPFSLSSSLQTLCWRFRSSFIR